MNQGPLNPPRFPSSVPKIVHSIWLDTRPLPDRLQGFRRTWEHHLPGFVFREWTRHNLPLEDPFVVRQMRRENYCFASDYLRWERVHSFGGIYFDCDVEVLRPLDDLLGEGGFLGFECSQNRIRKNAIGTAVFGFPPGHWLPEKMLDYFRRHPESTPLATDLLTRIMRRQGLKRYDIETEDFHFITVKGIKIFQRDILYPDTIRKYKHREQVPRQARTIHHVTGMFKESELDPIPWHRRLFDYRLDRKILRPVEGFLKGLVGKRTKEKGGRERR